MPEEVISAIASGTDRAQLQRQFDKVNAAGGDVQRRTMALRHLRLEEALQIRNLLMQTGDELTNLLRGLNGEYIPQHLVVIFAGWFWCLAYGSKYPCLRPLSDAVARCIRGSDRAANPRNT